MPHILVAGAIHQKGIDLLESAKGVTYQCVTEITTESYAPFVGDADAIVIRTQPITAAEIAAAPRLKIVSRHGVGFDAVDVEALNARSIPLAIVGDVNSRAVAEHALALMLAAARRTVFYDKATRDGDWKLRNRFDTTELDGKILLLLGFGRIGRRVGELAKAFGMTVLAHDPYVGEATMRAAGVEPVADRDVALQRADYVSLHIPLAAAGAVIGAAEISRMKPSAIIVNTARGGLIDEAALDAALRENRLFGAALDVFSAEPPQSGNPLLHNDRVTVSPHTASLTDECAARMAIASVQNVLDFFAGKLDRSLVVNAGRLRPSKDR